MTRDDEAEYVHLAELEHARAMTARCPYAGCLGPADGSECRHPDPEPDEVWCRRCAAPSTELVGGEAYCAEHAATERWKRASPSWRMQR